MKILSVVRKHYYGRSEALEPMFLYFTEPLRRMGHSVSEFDQFEAAAKLGIERAGEELARTVRSLQPDVVFYQTSGKEPISLQPLSALSGSVCTVAWNSDDDWQWPLTRPNASSFTYMITTYPAIYRAHKDTVPNLLLSQWACYRGFGDAAAPKTIPFSFVGGIYGARNSACRHLRRKIDLQCFGPGSRLVRLGIPYFKGAFRSQLLSGASLDFPAVNEIWNRSAVSWTPLGAGPDPALLQIKSRVFDMGLSGTLMLCDRTAALDPYYAEDKEYVAFSNLAECVEKASHYIHHDQDRRRITAAYLKRTLDEHTWEHRFSDIFRMIFGGQRTAVSY